MEPERKKPTLKAMRSNSVSDSLAKTLIALYEAFFEDQIEILWAIAQGTTSVDPKLFDSILVVLRDVCTGNATDGFMKKAIISEVKATDKHQQLFRGRSVAMRMMCAIYKVEGQMYMYRCLHTLFEQAADLDHEVKVDKTSSQATYDEFVSIVQPFLDTIWASADAFPPVISNIIDFSKLISEDRFPGNGEKITLINFVFLRFFSAVVVSPASFGFEPPKPISQFGNTFLMNLSKAISLLANSLFSEIQESPFTPLIKKNSEKCMAFLNEISTYKQIKKEERAIMTLPDGSPIVPKNVRDALKVILADIETNYARIVWTLKDFPFIANKIYDVLKVKGVKQLKTVKAVLQEPDPTKLASKVDEKFLVINTSEFQKDPPKPKPNGAVTESALSDEEALLRVSAHKKLDEILIEFTKGVKDHTEALKKEVEQEHAMRLRAEQEVTVLQNVNEALCKEVETLKARLAALEQQQVNLVINVPQKPSPPPTPHSPTNHNLAPPQIQQPQQQTGFSKGFHAAEAHRGGQQRTFQMGVLRAPKQQQQQPQMQQQQPQIQKPSQPFQFLP